MDANRQTIIYTRLSELKSDLSLASVEHQEARCRKLAADLGWEVIKVIRENELSGRNASAWKTRWVILPASTSRRVRISQLG